MSHRTASVQALTAVEWARRTGLTVKALRVYEREGLLKPKRSLKDWRIYYAADLARLGEVTALRALGLKLSAIATLLRGKSSDINRMLELQQEELLQRRQRIDAALATLSVLRRRGAMGETLTINDISLSINESQMSATTESIAWKRYEQMRPRIVVTPDPAFLHDSTGYYKFEDGPLIHLFLRGSRLMAQLQGQPEHELLNEAADSWFYTAVPAQVTFGRNAQKIIDTLTLHQQGVESLARKISEDEAKREQEDMAARVSAGTPHPDSRRLIGRLLSHLIKAEPYDSFVTRALAAIIAEQDSVARQLREELGAFKGLDFLAVTAEGWDAYRATFEQGEMDVSVYVDASGKIGGPWIEPPKAESVWKKLRAKFA